MKIKKLIPVLMLSLIASTITSCNKTKEDENLKEWTILNYVCASDLEEKTGLYSNKIKQTASKVTFNDHVNYLIQTGGTTNWKNDIKEDAGIELKVEKSQRHILKDGKKFETVYESDPVNMSDAKTLADFITWGVKNYPAKHYELVINDHGGGAYFGLLLDTQFKLESDRSNSNVMSFDTLEYALKTAGKHLDIINFNCCDNSCVSGIQAVSNYADYLLAFEESCSTGGEAMHYRAKYIFDNYAKSPKEMAIGLGETTFNQETEYGLKKLALNAVIDLSKTNNLTTTFNAFFRALGNKLDSPDVQKAFSNSILLADKMTSSTLIDLYDVMEKMKNRSDLVTECENVQKAIENSVLKCFVGEAHVNSHGINFTYSQNYSRPDLDRLARGESHNYDYLAYLDATTTNWEAPLYVYEKVQPFNNIDLTKYNVTFKTDFSKFEEEKKISFTINTGKDTIQRVSGLLYTKNRNDEYVCLGEDTNVSYDSKTGKGEYTFLNDWAYLTERGEDGTIKAQTPVCLEVTEAYDGGTLYNIPAFLVTGSILTFESNIVASLDNASGDFTIHGVRMFNSVKDKLPGGDFIPWDDLYKTAGLMRMIYEPTDGAFHRLSLNVNSRAYQSNSISVSSSSKLNLEMLSLAAGNYAYKIICKDAFGRDIYNSDYITFTV